MDTTGKCVRLGGRTNKASFPPSSRSLWESFLASAAIKISIRGNWASTPDQQIPPKTKINQDLTQIRRKNNHLGKGCEQTSHRKRNSKGERILNICKDALKKMVTGDYQSFRLVRVKRNRLYHMLLVRMQTGKTSLNNNLTKSIKTKNAAVQLIQQLYSGYFFYTNTPTKSQHPLDIKICN